MASLPARDGSKPLLAENGGVTANGGAPAAIRHSLLRGWMASLRVCGIDWMKWGRSVSALWQSRAGLPLSWSLFLGALPGLAGAVSVRPGNAPALALGRSSAPLWALCAGLHALGALDLLPDVAWPREEAPRVPRMPPEPRTRRGPAPRRIAPGPELGGRGGGRRGTRGAGALRLRGYSRPKRCGALAAACGGRKRAMEKG